MELCYISDKKNGPFWIVIAISSLFSIFDLPIVARTIALRIHTTGASGR
jgi:hypothetical protein